MALINYITQIQFEFSAIGLLKQQCQWVDSRCPLIVTDRGVTAAGLIDTLLDAFGRAAPRACTVALYDGTPPNSNEAGVPEAVSAYKEGDCDAIVAVARTSIWPRLRPSVRRMTTRCSFGVIEGGAVRITSRTAPVIAVPTACRHSGPDWAQRGRCSPTSSGAP
jgi:alcohol dehydrogenase class IV